MQFKISIRKANFKDTRFLLKIHNESVKRKFINSTKINNKYIYIYGTDGLKINLNPKIL